MNAALLSSKNMCWCTPQKFFDTLDKEFNFVLDAAATPETAKCSSFFTPDDDGLSQSWNVGGAVFCNPEHALCEWNLISVSSEMHNRLHNREDGSLSADGEALMRVTIPPSRIEKK